MKVGITQEKTGKEKRRGQKQRTEEVLLELRYMIAEHDLPPGTRLHELELAHQFSTSRSVVREAFGILEQRGLVNRIHNRGAVVARLDPKEVYEIFDVREVLEGMCTHQATINAPPETWDFYIELFGSVMEKAISDGEIERYIDALEELRREIICWADNTHATNFLDLVYDKARLIKRRVTLLNGRAAIGREMHLEMLKHMRAGEAAAAEDMKKRIIRSAKEWLVRYQDFVM
ncbi:GntR family transcriptional regulator [Billgrantia endophytica]|uniref:GntR family transcriptional regulator n=1 Tax=Billgrantia endophytica TaxID=2033802 RepID=A0A2N7UB39_9GAMM|nr:GntR family transcriptional regulator [Halomonas endophytica]PMR77656.1 GntR family transcriptional regulator [Halomonas endophytica]